MNTYAFIEHSIEYLLGIITFYIFFKNIFRAGKYKNAKYYFIFSSAVLLLTLVISLSPIDENISYTSIYFLSFAGELCIPLLIKGLNKFYAFMTALIYNLLIYFMISLCMLSGSMFIGSILHTQYYTCICYISDVIISVLFLLLSTVWKTKTRLFVCSVSKSVIILLAVFLFIGGTLCSFTTAINNGFDYRMMYLKVFLVLFSLIFTASFPVLIYNQIKKSQYMYESSLYEQQLNTQLEYYQSITKSGAELRKFRHDYNNMSIGLKRLLESKQNNKAVALLKKYDDEIITSFQILYNTGCDLADAILTDKQQKSGKNIKITFEGSLKNTSTDNLDICILLNNTLDIALKSAKQSASTQQQLITVNAVYNGGFLFFEITSPFSGNGKKADIEALGCKLSLNALEKLTAKNSGTMKTYSSGGRLVINIRYIC